MRYVTTRGRLAIVLAAAIGLLGSPAMAAQPTSVPAENEAAAGKLVRAALEAAADSPRRESLLQQALAVAPEYPPARWQAGFVRFQDQWLSPDEVEHQVKADGRWDQYRRLRDAHAGTPGGELWLARWCRKNGLEEESRFHWLGVVRFQPQNSEALRALGMRWDNGRLQTHAEIARAKREQAGDREQRSHLRSQQKQWEEYWPAVLSKWQRAVEQGDAGIDQTIHDALLAVEEPAAINALQALLQKPSRSEKEQAFRNRLNLEWIRVSDAGPKNWQNASRLVRFAVDHPTAEVRQAAAEALSKHPLEGYVPCLLGKMASPIEAHFVVYTYPDGGVSYQHSFYREGPDADYSLTNNESTYLSGDPLIAPPFLANPRAVEANVGRQVMAARRAAVENSLRSRAAAVAKATQEQRLVQRANAAVMQHNRRVQFALAEATGIDLGTDPNDWHAWWNERHRQYYELESPKEASEEKPVYEKRSSRAYRYFAPVTFVPTPSGCSCFPRGTKVCTLIGPMPIEEIRAGDRVLSQDPASGELTYQMVLDTTTRDPAQLISVGLGGETITATRGHPFWVGDEGWRMTKQLEVGMPLRGVSSVVTVDHVEELPAPKAWYEFAYNLIVDDFHTYFVGESRVLVHDNTPFSQHAPQPAL